MTTRSNVHPITDADLDTHRNDAEFRMQNIPIQGIGYDMITQFRAIPAIGGYLLPEPINHTLHTIRRGLCLYYELYSELSSTFSPQTAGAPICSFALFGMSALVVHELRQPAGENLATLQDIDSGYFKADGAPDDNLKMLLSYYLRIIKQAATANTIEHADDLINMTRQFFVACRDAMASNANRHPPEFLGRVEATTFRIGTLELRGFAANAEEARPAVSFVPIRADEIVGNSDAKRDARRFAERLAFYDREQRANPIMARGGLPRAILFDGPPGTGKSSIQRLMMTILAERAEQAGLPYHFVVVDPSIKDEYYGRSAKILTERINEARKDDQVTLLFFDDIDLLFVSRGDPNMGGADKDILTITMSFLSGTLVPHNGHAMTIAATNNPEALDSALRQRFPYKTLIAGPETWDDYARLLQIKLESPIAAGSVHVSGDMLKPRAATPAANPAASKRSGLLGGLIGQNKQPSWQEIGQLCMEFKTKDQRFTGRPIDNVAQRLLARSADFDIPEEWFTNPAAYREKPYDERVKLLGSLYTPITATMIMEELQHEFEAEQRYAGEASERRAKQILSELEAQAMARQLLTQTIDDGR